MLSREATNTNFIVFGLTQQGLVAMTCHTSFKHSKHYISNAVQYWIESENADE